MLFYAMLIVAAALSGLSCWGLGGFGNFAWLWLLPVGFLASLVALLVLAVLFLWVCSSLVNAQKPQEEDSKFFRFLVGIYAGLIMAVLRMRVHVRGMEKLPKSGRFMLVCNHLGDLDPVVLLGKFHKNRLAFISKQENQRKIIVGNVMHKILCQPINRENDKEALKTIIKCIDILKKDKASLGVFPEGYTSKDGLLHPFRGGVFKIAQKANVPIVVCTIRSTNKVFKNIMRLKSTPIDLHILDVIPAEELKGCTAVEIADRAHKLMADDLGPENVLQA